MKNIFNTFFKGKNENYDKAVEGLMNVKKTFDGFVIKFPDITPEEIMFVKGKWESLPKKIAEGVKIMALKLIKDNRILLTSYTPNGYMVPHSHNEFEHGLIVKGSLIDNYSGEIYKVGYTYKFKPNQRHFLCATSEGCLTYSVLNCDEGFNANSMTKSTKKIISNLQLT